MRQLCLQRATDMERLNILPRRGPDGFFFRTSVYAGLGEIWNDFTDELHHSYICSNRIRKILQRIYILRVWKTVSLVPSRFKLGFRVNIDPQASWYADRADKY